VAVVVNLLVIRDKDNVAGKCGLNGREAMWLVVQMQAARRRRLFNQTYFGRKHECRSQSYCCCPTGLSASWSFEPSIITCLGSGCVFWESCVQEYNPLTGT
jgi:hypothetical protein